MTSVVLRSSSQFSLLALRHCPQTIVRGSLIRSSPRALYTTSRTSKGSEDNNKEKNESLAHAEPVPWHYDNISTSPAKRNRETSVKGKGKLLSTPSRLLKLLLPLKGINNAKQQNKPAEPLALLVHPRQPLSYLERLIQSELPPITSPNSSPRPPEVAFKAVNIGDKPLSERGPEGVQVRPGYLRGGEGEGGAETGGGLGWNSKEPNSGEGGLIRWSTSTEVGDFVRDAARGREFVIEIEGSKDVSVGVPSFHQRTHYLRHRLLAITKNIESHAKLKSECDKEAHKGAQRVAMGGFAGMLGWWGGVYWLTFETRLGWDVMEPVTYLVGLSTVMGSYLWFLYHNREVSYRSILHMTVTKRQMKLYSRCGFDIDLWEELVDEGRALRREIKNIADQYGVNWDEKRDEAGGEKVLNVLKNGENKRRKKYRGQADGEGGGGEEVVEMERGEKSL